MRFFKTKPKRGLPITVDGFARGLRLMARALEKMEVQNGRVEWNFGVPRLVFEGGAAGIFEHPFRVYKDGSDYGMKPGRIHVYWDGEFKTIEKGEQSLSGSGHVYLKLDISAGGLGASIGVGSIGDSNQNQRYYDIAKLNADGSIDQRINQDIYETMGS